MNYFLWLELVGTLSSVVANQQGKNVDRELAYLNLLTTLAREKRLTDDNLQEIRARIIADKESGQQATNDDLALLEQRLLARSERIQGETP